MSAMAADVNVDGSVGAGLSLTVATPSAMVLFPGQTNTAVADVVVTSTSTWTLSIRDGGTYPTGHTAGHLAKLVGTGTCSLLSTFNSTLSQLASPLTWNATASGGNSGTLTGTNQTVKTGSLVDTIPVTYSQAVGSSEAVSLGDCYRAVVTYTAA